MTDPILLVDLENIQKINLTAVPGDVRVRVFYGVTQKKIPAELVVQAQPLGTRLEWIKISGHGYVCRRVGSLEAPLRARNRRSNQIPLTGCWFY